jgi:small subunit ribosomal protein S17
MGSGKGNPERWVAVVKPGRVIFELSYPDRGHRPAAMDRAIQKLPVKARSSSPERTVSMADKAITDQSDVELDEPSPRQARAVQPPVPARHRPAREHRPHQAGEAQRGANQNRAASSVSSPRSHAGWLKPKKPQRRRRPNERKVREGIVVSEWDGQDRRRRGDRRVASPPVQQDRAAAQDAVYVHDEDNTLNVGDRVRISETRPLSKKKRWRLLEIVERAR